VCTFDCILICIVRLYLTALNKKYAKQSHMPNHSHSCCSCRLLHTRSFLGGESGIDYITEDEFVKEAAII
jgi:hypothetical protein